MRTVLLGLALIATPILVTELHAATDRPDGVAGWRIVDSRTVFLLGNSKRWYRAETVSACSGLPDADSVGFTAGPDDSVDSFGALIVGGQQCALKSLTALPGDPPVILRRN